MGLSSREFWEMTPRQFALLSDRHYEKQRALAAMHGIEMKPLPKQGMSAETFHAFEESLRG